MTSESSAHGFATGPAEHIVAPLSPEDRSILALENETVVGHTCKVIVLDGQIDADQLRASVASRLDLAPELGKRLEIVSGEPCWVPVAALDLDAHVVAREPNLPVDDAGLRVAVADLFGRRLDRSRPLWRMDVIARLSENRSAVIWRIHHALADGTTAMRVARAVLWDRDVQGETPHSSALVTQMPTSPPTEPRRSHTMRTIVREAPRLWHRSPFDGHIGARRSVAFATADVHALRRAATACGGATLNDAVLTVVAGGLRGWLEAAHGHLGSVRVKVPVSLHGAHAQSSPHEIQPGNRGSFFCLDLPLGSSDPFERLAAIRRATKSRKDGHDAQRLDALMRELGRTSPRLRQFAERALAHPRSFALNVSNVKGPAPTPTVLGLDVRSMYSLAEIRERHALRVAAMSLGDTISFGVCADPTLIPDVDTLAEHMQLEAATLANCPPA